MALEALKAYAKQQQAAEKDPQQLRLIEGGTADEAESYTETQRRTWREAHNLYEQYAAISEPEQWQALADSCNQLAATGTLGKHLAAAIFNALEESSRLRPL